MRLRGRKGIRESLEKQPELVVLEPKSLKGKWSEIFGNNNPVHVELGMGKGQFISKMSKKNPDINFIGVDMYDELLRRASEKARRIHFGEEEEGKEKHIRNLKLALFNIKQIEDVFDEGEIERIYLNFSDPWPKKRHARRRLTHKGFLNKYRRILNNHGEIHQKTDSLSLFEFSLNSFADEGMRLRNISLNLHAEGPHPDHVMTEYESKFHDKGMNIYRIEVLIGSVVLHEHEQALQEKKQS